MLFASKLISMRILKDMYNLYRICNKFHLRWIFYVRGFAILLIREKDFYLIKQSITSFLEINNEDKIIVIAFIKAFSSKLDNL